MGAGQDSTSEERFFVIHSACGIALLWPALFVKKNSMFYFYSFAMKTLP